MTNASARDWIMDLAARISAGLAPQWCEEMRRHMDSLTAERDAEIMRWLGKKAREYRATGRKADRERADLITKLASQISRGAVRPDNTRLPAGVKPEFFEPGRTYTREHHGRRIEFLVRLIDITPDGAKYTAFGWRRFDGEEWEPTDSDDFTGWTEVAEAGQAPAPQHYDKMPDPLDGCHWCACGNRWPCNDATAVTA